MKNRSADGLRGIAALNVVACHFLSAFLPTAMYNNFPGNYPQNPSPSRLFEILTSPAVTIFYNGWWAVIVFFVLSGYVLTMPYFSGVDQKQTLEKRLWGRYWRLNIPIFAATMLGLCAWKLGLFSSGPAAQASESVWFQGYLTQGVTASAALKLGIYESIFNGVGTLIPPLWSLKIEFIGSIYVLILYIAKPRAAIVYPMLATCVFVFMLHQSQSIFYFAIFAGSLLNYVKDVKYKFILFAIGLYLGGYQSGSSAHYCLPHLNVGVENWDDKTVYNVMGAVLVTLSVVRGFGQKLFESRVFQFLGRISFSLYLTHFIVLGTLASSLYLRLPKSNLMLAGVFLIYLAASLLISVLFEKIVDRNAIRWSHFVTSKMGWTRTPFTQSLERVGGRAACPRRSVAGQ